MCNYCDYYTTEIGNAKIPKFVKMLQREIDITASQFQYDWQFDSIYLGGGSPALLSPKTLDTILNNLQTHFSFTKSPEITLEINPGENSLKDLQLFNTMGINRLSMGFQSLNNESLEILTRHHNQNESDSLYKNARTAGFTNINIDMLYNIPCQTIEGLLTDLQSVVNMKPEHITLISLTAEKGTPLYTDIEMGVLSLPHSEIESSMFEQGSQFLREYGFSQYEVSHFAKTGMEGIHNLHYWKRDPNLAFGPSAHGFDGKIRYWNVASLDDYFKLLSQNKLPIQNREILTEKNILNEIIMYGLRTNFGIPSSIINKNTPEVLNKWNNCLNKQNGSIYINPQYFHLADEIASDLMVD